MVGKETRAKTESEIMFDFSHTWLYFMSWRTCDKYESTYEPVTDSKFLLYIYMPNDHIVLMPSTDI